MAEGSYSGKKHLIVDLSAPHNNNNHASLNPVAVCWIVKHNYGIKFILHLLDDYLTIDSPSATAERTMALLTMIFNRLRVPIAPHKTVGPTVQLQYLGIILDTDSMEARLPLDKLTRIREMLH